MNPSARRTWCLMEVGTFFQRRRSRRVWLRVADLNVRLAVAEGNPLFPQVPALARVWRELKTSQEMRKQTGAERKTESWLPAELWGPRWGLLEGDGFPPFTWRRRRRTTTQLLKTAPPDLIYSHSLHTQISKVNESDTHLCAHEVLKALQFYFVCQ